MTDTYVGTAHEGSGTESGGVLLIEGPAWLKATDRMGINRVEKMLGVFVSSFGAPGELFLWVVFGEFTSIIIL